MNNITPPSGNVIGPSVISIPKFRIEAWIAFISISLVLLVQATIFGDGGISTLAVNAFSMGFVASFSGYYIFGFIKKYKFAPFIAGYLSLVIASFVTACVLGIQPIFWTQNGHPLYFPFDLKVTIPMMVIGHLLFGLAEGTFTQIIYTLLKNEKEKVYEI